MILCDTNILIEFYKSNPQTIQELRRIGLNQLAISVVTQAELYYGALNKSELFRIKKHLLSMHVLPIDEKVSAEFLNLMESYSLSHKLSVPDALIAATALVHQIELYTLNTRDFQFIPSIKLYS